MPKTKAKKPVKRTPILTPEPAAPLDESRQTFDTGAVRSKLDLRYDLLSKHAINHYTNFDTTVEILPADEIAGALMTSDTDAVGDPLDFFIESLRSIGALIHLDRTGVLSRFPSRHAVEAYAEAMAEGSAKYGDDNWLKGMPEPNLIQHAVNHLYLFAAGDRSEDHLGHAFWNVAAIIHFFEEPPCRKDR